MIRPCIFLSLAFFSSPVLAAHKATRPAFVPRTALTKSQASLAISELDDSAFSSQKEAQILAAYTSLLATTATELSRGGYQDNDYYNDGGYNDDYYNDDYYRDDDRGPSYDDRGSSKGGFSPSSFSMPDMIKTGNRKIGLPLLAIGGALTILGMSLFFNKTLMRLGNLFFVAGVPMTLGPGRTAGYFFQPKKARATACLMAGIFLVFVGWPIFGIILEAFGLLNLFGNMFPMAMMILKQMPVIGPLLKGDAGGAKRKNRNDDDRYSGGNNDRFNDDYDRYGGGDSYYNDRGYPEDDDNNDRYY